MVVSEFNEKYIDKVVELVDEYRSFYDFNRDHDKTKQFVLGLVERGENKLFLAIDQYTDSVMGFVNLYLCYSTLALRRLWILNDIGVGKIYRGRGVSKALIEKVINFARETAAVRIELKTDKANERALSLYKSMGFGIDNDNVYYRVPV